DRVATLRSFFGSIGSSGSPGAGTTAARSTGSGNAASSSRVDGIPIWIPSTPEGKMTVLRSGMTGTRSGISRLVPGGVIGSWTRVVVRRRPVAVRQHLVRGTAHARSVPGPRRPARQPGRASVHPLVVPGRPGPTRAGSVGSGVRRGSEPEQPGRVAAEDLLERLVREPEPGDRAYVVRDALRHRRPVAAEDDAVGQPFEVREVFEQPGRDHGR